MKDRKKEDEKEDAVVENEEVNTARNSLPQIMLLLRAQDNKEMVELKARLAAL